MEDKYNLILLNSMHEKYGTWEDVAKNWTPPVDVRTIHRWRKEAEFVSQILKAKEDTSTLNECAKRLGKSFEELTTLLKKYNIEDFSVALTERDPKLEPLSITTMDEYKKYCQELNDKCPPSLGYDHAEFSFKERILLVPVGDSHLGHELVDYVAWAETIQFIRDTPNTYAILVGDYTDAFTARGFKAGIYEQVITVPGAKDMIKSAILFIKDKILGIHYGCHDDWMHKEQAFDIAKWMTKHSAKGYWMGARGFYTLKVGDIEYIIYACHRTQYSSSKNPGHAIIEEFRNIGDFDLGICAHHHRPHTETVWERGKKVSVIQTSAFKETDRFLDRMGIRRAPILVPCAILDNKKKEITLYSDIKEAVKYL